MTPGNILRDLIARGWRVAYDRGADRGTASRPPGISAAQKLLDHAALVEQREEITQLIEKHICQRCGELVDDLSEATRLCEPCRRFSRA